MKLFSVVTLLLVVASYSADHVNAQPHRHIFQNVYNWFSGNKALSRAKSGSVLEHSNDGAHENVGVKANNNNNNNTWISKMQHGLEALAKELEQKIIDSDGSSLTQLPNTSTPMPEDDRPDEDEVEEIDDDEELEKCEMLNGTIGYCQPTKHCVMQEPEQRKFTVCKWSNGQEEKLTRSPPEKLCCPKVTVSMQQLKHNFEQWLEQSKKEMFAAGLPKKPDGHCGMSSVESQAQLDLRSFSRSEKLVRYPNKPRIVLGKNVQLGQIPWMVAIYYREQFLCGGSIISERHVVTAAHCLSSNRLPQDYTVRYESVLMFNGTRNQVQSFIIHEDYSPPAIYHDIALVTLAQPIKFNSFVQPVCLPGKRMYNELMVGQMGYVSGFGDLSFGGAQATLLQEVDIKVINNTFCDVNYRKLSESGRKFRHGIGKSLICAGYKNGGKDACQGDSGGPMTMNYRGANYLVGIVSFGYRCALPRFPGVYTCVAHYLNWIFDNLQV